MQRQILKDVEDKYIIDTKWIKICPPYLQINIYSYKMQKFLQSATIYIFTSCINIKYYMINEMTFQW